jgi:hypothetical protein
LLSVPQDHPDTNDLSNDIPNHLQWNQQGKPADVFYCYIRYGKGNRIPLIDMGESAEHKTSVLPTV